MRRWKQGVATVASSLALVGALGFAAAPALAANNLFGMDTTGQGQAEVMLDDLDIAAQIEGTWVIDSVLMGDEVLAPSEIGFENMTFVFKPFGEFDLGNGVESVSGNYMVADGLIYCMANDMTEIFVLDGDMLVNVTEDGMPDTEVGAPVFVRASEAPEPTPAPTPAPEGPAATASNPVGSYDEATGTYTNAYFGLAATLGEGWEVEAYAADELDGALEELESQGALQDFMAINPEAMSIIYSIVVDNSTHEVVDEAYLQELGELFASMFVDSAGNLTMVSTSTATYTNSTPTGTLEFPMYVLEAVADDGGQQMPVYVRVGFISQGDYLMGLAAVSFVEDATFDLLGLYSPYVAGTQTSASQDLIGMVDPDTKVFTNEFFGYVQPIPANYCLCAAGLQSEVDAAEGYMADYGVATDMVMQDSTNADTVVAMILEVPEGEVYDESFVENYADFVFIALLNASGAIPDPEYFGEDLSFLMGYSTELLPAPVPQIDSLEVVDATYPSVTVLGAQRECIHADIAISGPDGASTMYLTAAYVPQGDYVYLLAAISYGVDNTFELLESAGAM